MMVMVVKNVNHNVKNVSTKLIIVSNVKTTELIKNQNVHAQVLNSKLTENVINVHIDVTNVKRTKINVPIVLETELINQVVSVQPDIMMMDKIKPVQNVIIDVKLAKIQLTNVLFVLMAELMNQNVLVKPENMMLVNQNVKNVYINVKLVLPLLITVPNVLKTDNKPQIVIVTQPTDITTSKVKLNVHLVMLNAKLAVLKKNVLNAPTEDPTILQHALALMELTKTATENVLIVLSNVIPV